MTIETGTHIAVEELLQDCKSHLQTVTFRIVGDKDFNNQEICFAICNLTDAIEHLSNALQGLDLRCADKGV